MPFLKGLYCSVMKHSQPSVSHQDRLNALVVLEAVRGDAIGEALSYQHYRCREIEDLSTFQRVGPLH